MEKCCETSTHCTSPSSPYALLSDALSLIPISHQLSCALIILLIFFYNFLEIHLLRDLLSANFRGHPVSLTYNSSSPLCQSLASTCRILQSRFAPTFWLSSPHLQTAFLTLFGNSPRFAYKRQIFTTVDGGTIALDWLLHSDVKEEGVLGVDDTVLRNDKVPILIVVPGLTSDSTAAYIKHLAFKMAKHGWNVVVSNHRGLGGISITSDCFYNGGWTEDIRKVIDHIHCRYPEAPLYAVGTSIGANILVKYLGEDGVNTPLIGAAAICCPWDFLICDRFINRRLVQKFYDRVLAVGLQGYAQLHQSVISRLVDWDGIKKSRSVRDFDNHATRVLGKFETVDTYYRRSSSVNFIGNVSLPLLCISALDDPVCTREAIPWDECRENENIILAATQHGGHLAYYEGVTANSIWWVRAVDEFFHVLHSSPLRNRKKKTGQSNLRIPSEPSIDQAPFVNVMEDGMVTAVGIPNEDVDGIKMDQDIANKEDEHVDHVKKDQDAVADKEGSDVTAEKSHFKADTKPLSDQNLNDLIAPMRRHINQLSRHCRNSIWLLAYIAIVTSWPLMGPALLLFVKKKFNNIKPAFFRR